MPKFVEPLGNITTPIGRESTLTCVVDNLQTYKVAWLRVDTQTILTIATHVITKNHRVAVTRSDARTWTLHIREVKVSDRGLYMCQINTEPMMMQTGYLEVVVPPDFIDAESSSDAAVRESGSASLRCAAQGSPQPNITWRREDGRPIRSQGAEAVTFDGPILNITKASRVNAGAYLCIASNGVPPTISKRIMLSVHFPPMLWIQNQLVGAIVGQSITMECTSEAYPKSINYWLKDKSDIISSGEKYTPTTVEAWYKVSMKLTISNVSMDDFGTYRCVSKNSLGESDGSIKLYMIPTTTTTTTTTATTTVIQHSTTRKPKSVKKVDKPRKYIIPPTVAAPSTESISVINAKQMKRMDSEPTSRPGLLKQKTYLNDDISSDAPSIRRNFIHLLFSIITINNLIHKTIL